MLANNPKSYGSLDSVRAFLNAHPDAREEIISFLVNLEQRLQPGKDTNLREALSGPIVDLLFDEGVMLSRTIADGTKFDFRYSSRIAREFVMARDAKPDHVWEPQTTRAVVALSKGQSNVIVGGAYFGDHALLIAKALAKGGICHCFELSSDNLVMLRRNIEQNDIGNIAVNQEALWSEDGGFVELVGDDSHASPNAATGPSENAYPSRTIDSYVAARGIATPDVIMLDIEGGEFAALQGAKATLAKPANEAPALICEIHRVYADWTNGLKNTPLCAMMIENGYEVFAIRDYQGNQPMAGRFVELVDINSAYVDGPPHGFNLLAVKSRSRLDPAVFRIARGVSPKLLFHRDPKLHAPLNEGLEMP